VDASKVGHIFVYETEWHMNNEYQRICALRIKVGEIDLTRRPRVPIIKPSAEKKRPNQGDVFGASEKLE
jgi:hypothetical protein